MRKLECVLLEMIKIIPKEIGDKFNYILEEKIPWTPPEVMGDRWHDVQRILNDGLPADPNKLNEWQRKALKVWTGKDF